MNLVADEGVDGIIVSRLRSDVHEVYYVVFPTDAGMDRCQWRFWLRGACVLIPVV